MALTAMYAWNAELGGVLWEEFHWQRNLSPIVNVMWSFQVLFKSYILNCDVEVRYENGALGYANTLVDIHV